jgi:hypothetical protein
MVAEQVDWEKVRMMFEQKRNQFGTNEEFLESYWSWSEELVNEVERQVEILTGTICVEFDDHVEKWVGPGNWAYIEAYVL